MRHEVIGDKAKTGAGWIAASGVGGGTGKNRSASELGGYSGGAKDY